MAKKKITIGELGLKPRFLAVLTTHVLQVFTDEALKTPVDELIPKLDHEKLERNRGLGLKTIATFRDKLKALGYNYANCPFLLQRTKSEARGKLAKQLAHRKLSSTNFELIWSVAVETTKTPGVLNWVDYLYDE